MKKFHIGVFLYKNISKGAGESKMGKCFREYPRNIDLGLILV